MRSWPTMNLNDRLSGNQCRLSNERRLTKESASPQ
jgi:hypothetical protein